MAKFAVAILLLALTMPVRAEGTKSANDILPGCKGWLDREKKVPGPSEVLMQGVCFGFVEGLAYTGAFCVPSGVTNNQATAVVIKYIEARPERMHEQFGKLALEALQAAWPCKR